MSDCQECIRKDANISTLTTQLSKSVEGLRIKDETQKYTVEKAVLWHFTHNATTDVAGGTLSSYWRSVIAGLVNRAERAESELASNLDDPSA